MGVMLEHSACMFVDLRFRCFTSEDLKSYIDAGGVDSTFFGSDLGQVNNPTPAQGSGEIIDMLIELGYSDEDIRKMVGDNAARFIGLQDNAPRVN